MYRKNSMDLFYWNIGRNINVEKTDWILKCIESLRPDILCIAEGPESVEKCSEFNKNIEKENYRVYYSPTWYTDKVIDRQYLWSRFGIKVFVKNGFRTPLFDFSCQKFEGRIIYIRFECNASYYSMFIIHGTSKAGEEIEQHAFIIELSYFINGKLRNNPTDKVIIFGDFNLEPWDDLLGLRSYIKSCFFSKRYDFIQNSFNGARIYQSPIFEHIQSCSEKNLIGTFYNKHYTAILDYALFSKDINNHTLSVLTNVDGNNLFVERNNKIVLTSGFDHLPILLTLN